MFSLSKVYYGRRYVYSIQYHLVWCVKYRDEILVDQIDTDIKELLNQIAETNDSVIIEMKSDKDHIHLLIECKPQHYIPNIVK